MRNWKRNNKGFNEIIREDLGDNFEKWLEFFKKNRVRAFELLNVEDFRKIHVDYLGEIYQLVEKDTDCESHKKDGLYKIIVEKAPQFNKARKIARAILDISVLEKCEWYLEEESRGNRRKLLINTMALTLLIAGAAYAINLVWNGMQWFSLSSGIVLVSALMIGLCALFEAFGYYRIIGHTKVMPCIIALGTAASLFGIFGAPKEGWLALYLVFVVVYYIYFQKKRKQSLDKSSFATIASRGGLYCIPLIVAVIFVIHYRNDLANYLDFANTCHKWDWHKQEAKHLESWRKSAQYEALHKALKQTTELNNFDGKKTDAAYKNLNDKDPDRKCRKQVEAPWKGEFKKWLEAESKKAIAAPKNEKSCEKICNYMEYYRNKFGTTPVSFNDVMSNLFKPELKQYEQVQLSKICAQMDRFVRNSIKDDNENTLRKAELEYAVIPVLEDTFAKIKNINDEENEPESDALHTKFKYLESICKKHSGNASVKVLIDYKEHAKKRNKKISDRVRNAVDKYINDSDSSAWQACKGLWIEEFCNQIPGACYVLWKFGHPNVDSGKKQQQQWLDYLEKDQAGKIAESCYYAAEVYREKQENSKALKYYRTALLHSKGRYSWVNAVRHHVVALTADKDEQWENLWQLYRAKNLAEREYLMFARMCVERDQREVALEIYNKCPEAWLEISDLFTVVKLNKEQKQQLTAYRRLAARLEKNIRENNKNIIGKFCELGNEIAAADAAYDFLRKAVVRGNSEAPEFYIAAVKKLKKLDEDAVNKLVDNKKFDKQIIDLAKLTDNEPLFIQEAKRWEKEKYNGYQKHVVNAGAIFYEKNDYVQAWELWSKLTNKELAPIWDKYCKVLDSRPYLNDKDMEFFAEYSIKHNVIIRLTKLAEYFENKEEYVRAVYFWSKSFGNNAGDGKIYYKLFECTELDKQDKEQAGKYSFDQEAAKVYGVMKLVNRRKENLYKAAFDYHYKKAVLDLGEMLYTGVSTEYSPEGVEKKEIKDILRKLLKTQDLTAEERNNAEKYVESE